MESWEELETNLKQTGSLIDAKIYREFIGQKNNNQLPIRTWSIKTSWHSWKGFFYGVSTKKFQDFIHKWEVKEASPTIYPVMSQNEVLTREYKLINPNKNVTKSRKISTNLLMVILWVVAIIIAGIMLLLR